MNKKQHTRDRHTRLMFQWSILPQLLQVRLVLLRIVVSELLSGWMPFLALSIKELKNETKKNNNNMIDNTILFLFIAHIAISI